MSSTPLPEDLSARLEFAVGAARQAGRSTLELFRSEELVVETKQDGSPVTQADRKAEQILRERIQADWPRDGILGEEFGESEGTNGCRWILDPIDGTAAFCRAVPLFGTLVALELRGQPILGVIYMPALDEMVYAASGGGAFWQPADRDPRPARVSSVERLDAALLCCTSVTGFDARGEPRIYSDLRAATGSDRGWGDCYGHLLVATGRADIMLDATMAIWDCAALQPIIEEAGGRFTDLSGRATHEGGSAVSTNGRLHEPTLEVIRGARA